MDKKLLNGGIFAEAAAPQISATAIRGVQYIVLGFFDGDKPVQERLAG